MQTEFKNLAWKCYSNDLRFEYIPDSNGVIVSDGSTLIGNAYLDQYSIPELELLSRKIDWYLNGEIQPNKYVFNRLEYERKMQEAGHKQTDFL